MRKTVTLKFDINTDAAIPDAASIRNFVRRTLDNTVTIDATAGVVKGLEFEVKDSKYSEHTEVRNWALATGLPVGQRGRVSDDLIAAYRASH